MICMIFLLFYTRSKQKTLNSARYTKKQLEGTKTNDLLFFWEIGVWINEIKCYCTLLKPLIEPPFSKLWWLTYC